MPLQVCYNAYYSRCNASTTPLPPYYKPCNKHCKKPIPCNNHCNNHLYSCSQVPCTPCLTWESLLWECSRTRGLQPVLQRLLRWVGTTHHSKRITTVVTTVVLLLCALVRLCSAYNRWLLQWAGTTHHSKRITTVCTRAMEEYNRWLLQWVGTTHHSKRITTVVTTVVVLLQPRYNPITSLVTTLVAHPMQHSL